MSKPPHRGWTAAGAAFVIGAGALLHFAFAWGGGWRPLALIAAVNESTWEHLKMAYWPTLLWGAIRWRLAACDRPWPALAATAAEAISSVALIVALYYGYVAIHGGRFLAADLAVFGIAIACGQALGATILRARDLPRPLRAVAAAALLLSVAAFSTFTYAPPAGFLFRDPRTGGHGIPG